MEFSNHPQFFFLSPQGKIHYRYCENEGRPRICILPGFMMPAALYVNIAKQLHRASNAVIIVDYWGRGFSEQRADRNYSLRSHVSLVASLLHHLRISKCSFIGVSYGAAVVAGLSTEHPDLIERIAVVSPLHFTMSEPSSLQKAVLGTPTLGPLLLWFTAGKTIPMEISRQFADAEGNSQLIADVSALCLKQFRRSSTLNVISQAVWAYDPREVDRAFVGLASVNAPMLAIIGERDALIDVDKCQVWWGQMNQNTKVTVVNNAGHLLVLEREKEVFTELNEFFAQ